MYVLSQISYIAGCFFGFSYSDDRRFDRSPRRSPRLFGVGLLQIIGVLAIFYSVRTQNMHESFFDCENRRKIS